MSIKELEKKIDQLRKQMYKEAEELHFEEAALLRDQIQQLQLTVQEIKDGQ